MAATQGERLAAIETEIREMKSDISKQGELIKEIHKMGQIQATQTEQIKTLCACYEKQNERLDLIEKKPARRWDYLVITIIAALVSFFVSQIPKMFG